MKSAIRKVGNSHGIIIPRPMLGEIGVGPNDPVDLRVKKGRLVITPVERDPRAGWAEVSEKLAAENEGGLVWPDVDHPPNGRLKW
jgi:antitoxin MazE